MNIKEAYITMLERFSPYRGTPNMPNWGLWHRVNDDYAKDVPRIAVMIVWALIGALPSISSIVFHFGHPMISAFIVLAGIKVAEMKLSGYSFDPLDWLCDAGAWGLAGAYFAANAMSYTIGRTDVYMALLVLWLICYPFSTPR